jgi:hypothetical protein
MRTGYCLESITDRELVLVMLVMSDGTRET